MKTDKTKEKGSQHDLEHAADEKETPVGGVSQNADQRFITMAEVAALLEQKRARASKERFYVRRPPYPLRVLSKPYLERYEPRAFAQYNGRKGSTVEHVSKFIDTLGPYATDENLCLWEFSKSLCDQAYTWYIGLEISQFAQFLQKARETASPENRTLTKETLRKLWLYPLVSGKGKPRGGNMILPHP